jgi:hypothetical protein
MYAYIDQENYRTVTFIRILKRQGTFFCHLDLAGEEYKASKQVSKHLGRKSLLPVLELGIEDC